MYVRTRDTLGRIPPSYIYDSWKSGIGDSPSAKPVLLTHFHVRKYLDPRAGLLSDPYASVMKASQMQPGFVPVADPRRQALQKELSELVQNKYRVAVSPKVQLRIALVDLTNAKQHSPIFAGSSAFGTGNSMEGGSLVKILALHAVYQLRFDLNTFAARNGIAKGSV